MCGICGVYNAQSGEPVSQQLIEHMTHLISHRGPDDSGAYLDGPVGLGFARLHGMFGFAIWDSPRRRLLLARDRAGEKPLYYTRVNGNLLFASEIKSLLCYPGVKRQVDLQALGDFLSVRYVPGPATLFANIYKVQPGHWLLCENDTIHEECYWDFTFGKTEHRPLEEYIQGIRQHVHRAVEERMMADVPLGALLSGGVDSSIIVGTMSQLTSQPVKTFAVGFDVPGYSELPPFAAESPCFQIWG